MDALSDALTARLDMEGVVNAGHAAMGGPHCERLLVLSPAEEVLAIPYLSQRSVMSFLFQGDVLGCALPATLAAMPSRSTRGRTGRRRSPSSSRAAWHRGGAASRMQLQPD